jgi:hypothetical protein
MEYTKEMLAQGVLKIQSQGAMVNPVAMRQRLKYISLWVMWAI